MANDNQWESKIQNTTKAVPRRFKLYEWDEIASGTWERQCTEEGITDPHGDDLDENEMAELARIAAVRKRRAGL